MQALCQLEVLGETMLSQLDEFLADENPPRSVQDYARNLVHAAQSDMTTIDHHIQGVADNWALSRMAPVDRNILRVAVCELIHRTDVPPRVVVDEAIEIAKAFGAAESAGFVNGVLDAVIKRRLQEPPASESCRSAEQVTASQPDTTTEDAPTEVSKRTHGPV